MLEFHLSGRKDVGPPKEGGRQDGRLRTAVVDFGVFYSPAYGYSLSSPSLPHFPPPSLSPLLPIPYRRWLCVRCRSSSASSSRRKGLITVPPFSMPSSLPLPPPPPPPPKEEAGVKAGAREGWAGGTKEEGEEEEAEALSRAREAEWRDPPSEEREVRLVDWLRAAPAFLPPSLPPSLPPNAMGVEDTCPPEEARCMDASRGEAPGGNEK